MSEIIHAIGPGFVGIFMGLIIVGICWLLSVIRDEGRD